MKRFSLNFEALKSEIVNFRLKQNHIPNIFYSNCFPSDSILETISNGLLWIIFENVFKSIIVIINYSVSSFESFQDKSFQFHSERNSSEYISITETPKNHRLAS